MSLGPDDRRRPRPPWSGLISSALLARSLPQRGRSPRRSRAEVQSRARLSAGAKAELRAFTAARARLAAPKVGVGIDVSVIVVVWNQPHLVLRCLRALIEHAVPSLEVILVDNGSGRPTRRLLSRLDGVVQLRNRENVGFLRACNQAAAVARGRNLLLLNSDAFVREGAIAHALAAVESDPGIGAVGGRLILPNGELQEAGGIIWTDGTTSGYGRGLAPEASLVMFQRDVDYCSGAFLMTPRGVWEHLGGFDEAYAPGYYEEADYCMRLRAAGFRVVYEPSVAVDHYELGSEAKAGDAASLSERNRGVFLARFGDSVWADHFARSPRNARAASDRSDRRALRLKTA